jgi:hypothetical protein
MMKMNLLGVVFLGLLASVTVQIARAQEKADCAVSYTRSACPGKETESFAKCDGKATCTKNIAATSPAACQDAALKACANDRLDVTKSKIISASFKGESLKSSTGKADFCADYANRATEFDRCGK